MSLALDAHVIGVRTCGVAMLPTTWSGKLLARLATLDPERPNFRVVREAYDGLPMRVAEEVAGEQIFSRVRVGPPVGWHRGRTDAAASGAPASFIAGMCIAGPTGPDPVRLSVVAGSARLPIGNVDAVTADGLVSQFDLAPGDVAVLDSRCVRRWSSPTSVFQLSVVRSWVEPEQDARSLLEADTPPRAARFAGQPSAPASTLESWLFERHERRG